LPHEPWTHEDLARLGRLRTPAAIQAFLDSIPYSSDPIYRCPRRVMRDRVAHCFDGAVFAGAALRRIGLPPLLVDLEAVRDDDHVLAVFRRRGHWGAIAKSNFVGLRWREPVFRTVRELVLSYFEDYYNSEGEKTLRSWSSPLDLRAFDRLNWTVEDGAMDAIAAHLDSRRHLKILTPAMERSLARMDERSLRAGMLGINEAGLYRPGR